MELATQNSEAPLSPVGSLHGEARRRYALAGDAVFTIRSAKTGQRFTYRVRAAEKPGIASHFVEVLTGPDNTASYEYLGFITPLVPSGTQRPGRGARFVHGHKSRIGPDAPSAKAFAWCWERLALPSSTFAFDFIHSGRCGKCGRLLTDPTSIEVGLGPTCRGVS